MLALGREGRKEGNSSLLLPQLSCQSRNPESNFGQEKPRVRRVPWLGRWAGGRLAVRVPALPRGWRARPSAAVKPLVSMSATKSCHLTLTLGAFCGCGKCHRFKEGSAKDLFRHAKKVRFQKRQRACRAQPLVSGVTWASRAPNRFQKWDFGSV